VSMRILIVDPDWHFFAQARDFLEARGHFVVHRNDADQAVERARCWKPDVVIVSAELTACCDGDLLRRLAAVQPRPAILLAAGLDAFDKAWRAWQHGGDDLLFKPLLHSSELHVALVTALENSVCPRRQPVPAPPAALSA